MWFVLKTDGIVAPKRGKARARVMEGSGSEKRGSTLPVCQRHEDELESIGREKTASWKHKGRKVHSPTMAARNPVR